MYFRLAVALLACAGVSGGGKSLAKCALAKYDDVQGWLETINLPAYAGRVDGTTLAGRHPTAVEVDEVVSQLNVTNRVHVSKITGHLAAVRGECPCNVPPPANLWTAYHRFRAETLSVVPLMIAAPRLFLVVWECAGPAYWVNVVSPPSAAAFTTQHEPSNFTARRIDAAGAPDAASSQFVLNVLLAVLLPYPVLFYTSLTFVYTNPFLCGLLWLTLLEKQAGEVLFVMHIDSTVVSRMDNKDSWRIRAFNLAKATLVAFYQEDGGTYLINLGISLAAFLLSFVLPLWAQGGAIILVMGLDFVYAMQSIMEFLAMVGNMQEAGKEEADS
ncbi:hypothetical protein DIPPA_19332 [Diplonema papillatum]|nr:hypothetical protein DIPPA_19332 [Diplonema papillatum]